MTSLHLASFSERHSECNEALEGYALPRQIPLGAVDRHHIVYQNIQGIHFPDSDLLGRGLPFPNLTSLRSGSAIRHDSVHHKTMSALTRITDQNAIAPIAARPPAIPSFLINPKHRSMYRTVSRHNALHLVVSFLIASLHVQLDVPAGSAYREGHSDNHRPTQDVSIAALPSSLSLTCGGALGLPSVERDTTVAMSVARVSTTLRTCMGIVQL